MTVTEIKTESKLVTHFIAGYPDLESSFEAAVGLIDGGAFALEMQLPYSDPSADGPVIEAACREALENGFRVSDGFRLLQRIKKYRDIPVFVMSYSGLVYNMGVRRFCSKAHRSGADGIIIPDLVPGDDEGLYGCGAELGLDVIPVIVPGVHESRLDEIFAKEPGWIYLALRRGITGAYTEIGEENISFLDKLKQRGSRIMAGFGVKTPEQVRLLCSRCDAAIAGSFIVQKMKDAREKHGKDASVMEAASEAVKYLIS